MTSHYSSKSIYNFKKKVTIHKKINEKAKKKYRISKNTPQKLHCNLF